jgi:hypothetical protein
MDAAAGTELPDSVKAELHRQMAESRAPASDREGRRRRGKWQRGHEPAERARGRAGGRLRARRWRGGLPSLSLPKVEWTRADVTRDVLEPLFRGADAVVHLAG